MSSQMRLQAPVLRNEMVQIPDTSLEVSRVGLGRGLLSGRMRPGTTFDGDDLRRDDPKFQAPRFAQYLGAVRQLDALAQRRFRRGVIQLAVRWMLDQGISVALRGGRHPGQVEAALGAAAARLIRNRNRQSARIAAAADALRPVFQWKWQ